MEGADTFETFWRAKLPRSIESLLPRCVVYVTNLNIIVELRNQQIMVISRKLWYGGTLHYEYAMVYKGSGNLRILYRDQVFVSERRLADAVKEFFQNPPRLLRSGAI